MITGKALRDAFISAANNITNQRKAVDALNVFPVPDGDTGTNMSMTINAAKRELQLLDENLPVGEVAGAAASALLRGARGNSGVILSLLFRGFARGLNGLQEADANAIADALDIGVEAAYNAVMKPTEGTILTVARESAQKVRSLLEEAEQTPSVSDVWTVLTEEAKASLANTPELLPVLKKAGVVDAGGKGLTVIYEGMLSVFTRDEIIPSQQQSVEQVEMPVEKNAAGEYEGEITFTYCTEFIVIKEENGGDALSLRAYLESIGDCVVVVEDEEIIKCHVHTDNPGNAMQKALESGMLTNMKIENMRLQHANQKKSAAANPTKQYAYAPVNPDQEYGFVAVAAGDGVHNLFHDLGVQNVVSGGQTMNPSTDDLLEAIHATPAKTVIVLPNNKNIIMAAEQAVKLADRNVYVLPTKTIPQGLSSLLAFDPEADLQTNQLAMVKAIEKVQTGQVTFAARDSNYEGHKIKKGDILALENGKVSFTDKDVNKAAYKLVKALLHKDSTFVTVLYGQDTTEKQVEELEAMLQSKLPESVEVAVLDGGQPVYYYTISVE